VAKVRAQFFGELFLRLRAALEGFEDTPSTAEKHHWHNDKAWRVPIQYN
jgi:hypothetical protein